MSVTQTDVKMSGGESLSRWDTRDILFLEVPRPLTCRSSTAAAFISFIVSSRLFCIHIRALTSLANDCHVSFAYLTPLAYLKHLETISLPGLMIREVHVETEKESISVASV